MADGLALDAVAAAMRQGDGAGIRIAMLDSGVEIGHPDFGGRALRDDLVARDGGFAEGLGTDLYGHGTALAGIIWRLAPRAEIGSFRVLGPNLSARTAMVSLAVEQAIELGYHVLHCSFACGIPGHLIHYKRWTDRAALEGIHVVAASGSHSFHSPEWPAHFATVLGVDFHAGPQSEIRHWRGSMVEFFAPGVDVLVPWTGASHRVMTGSSFAAAHLTGLLARVLSAVPLQDALLTKALLRQSAKPSNGEQPPRSAADAQGVWLDGS